MLDRDLVWQRLALPFDVLVIGGGVTGAAILREAARRNLRAALIEREDFASGASSKSSKLVHGGLRYLREGRFGLTRESVREREELLRDAPGLIEPLRFLLPHYRGGSPGATKLELGLRLYDLFAGRNQHRRLSRDEALRLAPSLVPDGLRGAHEYLDATTDDARLVLRLIQDAEHDGAAAINYCEVEEVLLREGRAIGVGVVDRTHGRSIEIEAAVTVNASGAWSDSVRALAGEMKKQLRPLRGSHLLFPLARLPLVQAVAFAHPRDHRPVFAYPWLGATLLGTTDLDHREDLGREPSIAREEVDYLMEAASAQFPAAALRESDALASFAGVRPVIDSGKRDPSKETRDALVASQPGMVTVTGGKLTTFRPTALAALRAVQGQLAKKIDTRPHPAFRAEAPPRARDLVPAVLRRLGGCYGSRAQTILDGAPDEHAAISGTPFLWAELRFAARGECVARLDDLLLRRTRVGLLLENGASEHFERIRTICAQELHWDGARWERELAAYRTLLTTHYGLPA